MKTKTNNINILALSTSSRYLSLVVCKKGSIESFLHIEAGLNHSSMLIEKVKEILKDANLNINKIDLFTVDLGPGSFTGTRVGVTAMKTAAKALKKAISGTVSLDIIARGMEGEKGFEKCVILDAKRSKMYMGIYGEKKEYFLLDANDAFNRIKKRKLLIAGDAVDLYKEKIKKNFKIKENVKILKTDFWYPDARNLCEIAFEKYSKQQLDDADLICPNYFYPYNCSIRSSKK